MNNLRQLTLDNHKRAERSKFISKFVKRELTPYQYYVYLSNQLMCYYVLESVADGNKLLDDLQAIKRSVNISKDLAELEVMHGFEIPKMLPSTTHYIDYVQSLSHDTQRIMAHIYVRHMGDLSGGQMLRKLVPGTGLHYQFSEDVDVLKDKIREKLNDNMADEANRCFDMIYNFFEELEASFNDMGTANKTTK